MTSTFELSIFSHNRKGLIGFPNMNLTDLLNKFGYSDSWYDLGIIDTHGLEQQLNEYSKSNDKNEEHYRAKSFLKYINSKSRFTDLEIKKITELTDNGPDGVNLHSNRIHELILCGHLSNSQYNSLNERTILTTKTLRRIYARIKLIRMINDFGFSDKVNDLIKSSDDSGLQLIVIQMENTPAPLIKWFCENGLNKKIKNISKEKANRITRNQF